MKVVKITGWTISGDNSHEVIKVRVDDESAYPVIISDIEGSIQITKEQAKALGQLLTELE